MSEIDRIRAAAAHPENWKIIKKPPTAAEQAARTLQNLATSSPGIQPRRRSASRFRARRARR